MPAPTSISIKLNHRQLVRQMVNDNPLIIEKICSATNLDLKASKELLVEVIKFLDLIVISGQRLTPSCLVDLAWHELILFTRSYKNFCEQTWGRFIHHHPGGKKQENQKNFQKTLTLYTQHWGNPPAQFWLNQDENQSIPGCGPCHAF